MYQAKDHLIFALDVPSKAEALRLARLLREEVGLFKVGLELYLSEGPSLLQDLIKEVTLSPSKFFLDLKLYDIPATVLGALHTVLHGVALTTVPADLGLSGLQKIVAAMGTAYKILAVTVLTSMTAADLKSLGFTPRLARDPVSLVVHKAKLAQKAGCAGVVCSGREVAAVKQACGPGFLAVCPGIRPDWAKVTADDQSRTVTPYEAIRNGADYLVVGRPIRTYPESAGGPAAAARRVVQEIAAALRDR
jgi:orotidine-5'-phosphate decarboxylase